MPMIRTTAHHAVVVADVVGGETPNRHRALVLKSRLFAVPPATKYSKTMTMGSDRGWQLLGVQNADPLNQKLLADVAPLAISMSRKSGQPDRHVGLAKKWLKSRPAVARSAMRSVRTVIVMKNRRGLVLATAAISTGTNGPVGTVMTVPHEKIGQPAMTAPAGKLVLPGPNRVSHLAAAAGTNAPAATMTLSNPNVPRSRPWKFRLGNMRSRCWSAVRPSRIGAVIVPVVLHVAMTVVAAGVAAAVVAPTRAKRSSALSVRSLPVSS